jgi:hypothetical protein
MTRRHSSARAEGEPTGLAEPLYSFLATQRHLVGAALLRLGLGTLVLYQLLGHWFDRGLLWGPRGLYPAWLYSRDFASLGAPSFFAVASETAFEAAYMAAVLVALLYLLGWQTRWVGIWFYVLVWSLIKRNPLLLTGGDTLVLVMMPFLLFLNTSAYLSVDSGWRRIDAAPPPVGDRAALLHNVALGCIFVQIAVFYGCAGLYKLLGATWPAGSAVYYTLRLPEFERPGISELIYANGSFVRLLSFSTLGFELSVPLLLWSRRTRWLVTLLALGFHAFIAFFMGLAVFSAQALVFQLVLFDDSSYRRLARRWSPRAWRWPRLAGDRQPRVSGGRSTGPDGI